MQDWCSSEIYINHNNKNGELKRLKDLIEKWAGCITKENHFVSSSLDKVILNSGIDTDLSYRGTIEGINLYSDQLHISTETAWEPMLKMWQRIVDKYLPEAKITYTALEPGYDLYVTNDPDYEGCYSIDSLDESIVESNFCATEQDVIEALKKYLKSDKNNLNELKRDFENLNAEDIWIGKWEQAPLDHWD